MIPDPRTPHGSLVADRSHREWRHASRALVAGRTLFLLVLAIMACANHATAGVYAGIGVGHGHVLSRLDARAEIGIGTASFDGLGGHGVLAGVLVGYEFGKGRFPVSFEADFTMDNMESSLRIKFLGEEADGKLMPEATLILACRVGIELTENALMFARVGYGASAYGGWLESDINEAELDKTTSGHGQFWAVGAGTEIKVSDHFALRAEYTYNDFRDNTEHDNGIEWVLRPSVSWARLAVVYRF